MSPLNKPELDEAQRVDPMPREGEVLGDLSRRRLLHVMGASMALAAASGCTWQGEEILPFQRRPEGRIPGKTRRFATSFECASVASSLFVTSYDGRPIKVEGNPLHPQDGGACTARSQAGVLDLYDPDHSSGLVQTSEHVAYPRTWAEFDPWFASLTAAWRTKRGAGLRILAEPSSSLTLAALRAKVLAALPDARWIDWEPIARTQEVAGAKLAFGRAVRVQPSLDKVRTLVFLDADMLGEHPTSIAFSRAFARRRDAAQTEMLRAWSVESSLTLTGAAADHRLALRAAQTRPFVIALEHRIAAKLGTAADTTLAPNGVAPTGGFLDTPRVAKFLEHLAAELVERKGESLLCVGPRQPAIVHAIAHRLNAALGNVGRTLVYSEEPEGDRADPKIALAELVREMQAGAVEALVILGGNPVYDAPADLDFKRALRSVPTSLHLSHYRDETSRAATWHLPRAHALESWGDALSFDGTRCTQQPLIDRIYERRTPIEVCAQILGLKDTARDLVRASVAPQASDADWKRALGDGFVADSSFAALAVTLAHFDVPAVEASSTEIELGAGVVELVFAPDPKLFDGRSANNAWLQELPNPITRISWGNALELSPQTATALGLDEGSLAKLKVGERELEVAVTLVPGHANGSATLHLGHGRTAAGVVGGLADDSIESVGFDAYRLRTSAALDIVAEASLAPTGAKFAFARVQDPALIDAIGTKGRDERIDELLRETEFARQAEFASDEEKANAKRPPLESLWEHTEQTGARWGMAIDLNACTGCNACVVACQAENNVPVVGREQVARGRAMHWIRIDRYFKSSEHSPRLRFQPVTCQHCEDAPCEQVCPVAATMHSSEGLNDMVYNRCIGTRYCANNCPFKVRRFNFFNYHRELEKPGHEVQRMLYNPDVTLRHRGVMEKCTFCVQRIQSAKIGAKNAGRALVDGEIVPACAQTCPTQAIVFGDLADAKSRVAKSHANSRSYAMLEELNIRPRTAYLAKVVNPNSEAQRDDV